MGDEQPDFSPVLSRDPDLASEQQHPSSLAHNDTTSVEDMSIDQSPSAEAHDSHVTSPGKYMT